MLQSYLLDTVPGLVPEDIKQKYPNDKTGQINTLLGKNPLLFDTYLTDAIEVDVDCLQRRHDHLRVRHPRAHRGGRHPLRRQRLLAAGADAIDRDRRRAGAPDGGLARALNVGGLMNVQYAIQNGTSFVLEVNPRASRTVPFVAKTIGQARSPRSPPASWPASHSTRPSRITAPSPTRGDPGHIAVKEAVFPFARFPGVDILLGPEMRSTGEVMGLDYDFALAFAKSQLGAGVDLPRSGTLFVSVRDPGRASCRR